MLMLVGTTTVWRVRGGSARCWVSVMDARAGGPSDRRVSPPCYGLDRRPGPTGLTAQGRVTCRMPRHISSVVPSPHTTYRSSWPSNAGQLVAQPLDVAAGHLDRVAGVSCTGSIGFAPWLSKSQTGMSRTVCAAVGAGVDLDLDRAAEQVHVAGDAADRRRPVDRAGAGLHVARRRRPPPHRK